MPSPLVRAYAGGMLECARRDHQCPSVGRSAGVARTARLRGALGAACLALAVAACGQGEGPLATASPSAVPTAVPSPPRVALDVPSRPVRVRVPSLGIDLPVISFDRRIKGSTPGYPACDVASYWDRFDLPGQPGTTWLLAHAQAGMFLPLLVTSNATNGRGLLGRRVGVQVRDGRLLTYRTFRVRLRAAPDDVRIARQGRRPDEQRLVLQTSTGVGDAPKLQVAARLVSATRTDEPPPRPRPRACG
jgi:hypothetical protein